jgi:iron(III) transport system permease protein
LRRFDALGAASLASYARVLDEARVQRAIGNTIVLVLASATVVMALSSLIAWFSVRGRTLLARWVDVIAFAPTAVPPIVMVMAILFVTANLVVDLSYALLDLESGEAHIENYADPRLGG